MKNKKKVITSVLLLSALGMGLASCENRGNNSSSESSEIVESKYKVEAISSSDVEIHTDVTEAKEGDTITITVNVLNEEKVLADILANGKKDGINEITKGSKYTYLMGKEDIKITATLADKVYENHQITINEVEGFNVSFKIGEGEASSSISAKKGDLVTVIIDVTSDTHRFKEIACGDVTLSLVKNENNHIEETFVMVDKDISLNLVSEAIPTHQLSVIASAGMSVKFFFKGEEVTEGIEGKEINIKISLEDKYVFGKIESVNEGLELKTVKEGEEYSFIMPSEAATFVATCSKVVNKYSLSDIQTCGGVTILSGIEKGAKIDEGETVTFSFSYTNKKDGSYTLSYGAYINDELVMASLNDTTMIGEITFNMPSKDATIYVGPFNEPLEEETSSASEVVLPELNDNYKIFGVKNGWYDQGGDYSYRTMKLYILGKKEFVVSKFAYSNGYRDTTLSKNSDDSYTFSIYNISKGSSTTLKIEGSIKELKTITFTDIDNIDIEGDYSSAPEGAQVSLKIKAKEGFKLDNAYYPNYIVKSYQYGDKTNTGISWNWENSTNTLSFKMPDADLTITLNVLEQITLSVSNPDSLKSYKFTETTYSSDEITSISGGKTVYFWPVAKDNEKVKSVFVNDSTTSLTQSKKYTGEIYYSFVAPETGSVSLTIETSSLHTFTAESTDAYDISDISSTSNAEGDEVSFKLIRKIGYKVTKVALSNGTEISLKAGSVDTYSFIMPNEDVTLNVTTEEVSIITLTLASVEPFSTYHVRDIYGVEVNNNGSLNVGETYSISFTKKNGYNITGITLSEGEATKESDTKYTFTAPSNNLTLTPVFAESEKHTITIANEDSEHYVITSVTDDYNQVDTTGSIYGYVGHSIRIRISSNNNSSKIRYFANSKIVNALTGEEVTSSVSTQDEDSINLSFLMPSFDVKLQFDILEKQSHNVIKNNNADLFKISDSSSGTNELTSYVKGTKLYMVLNMNEYQFAFYNSVKIEWSYTLNGETTTDSYTFTSKKDWNPIQSAPDCDLTFTLILSEPTEKVTINKEDTDQKAKLGISTSYSSYDFFDFGDNFEIKKGKGLYAVLTSYETSDFSGGKYVINITNSDTNEIVKTLNITSSYGSKYVYFTADSNLIISLTYVQNN